MKSNFYGLLAMIIIATVCVLVTIGITYNIEQRIKTLQQQNDSIKQELILLNQYLYD